jgi:chromate transport protein ChrA
VAQPGSARPLGGRGPRFESGRPDLKWLGITIASVAFGLPPIAFAVALVLVQGHAGIAYFEAVAQIIPILILALAIELRYFSPARQPPETLGLLFQDPVRARVVAALYAAATLLALVLSEAVALWVLAEGSSNQLQLSITTAGLTAGAVALVAAILLPAGEEAAR